MRCSRSFVEIRKTNVGPPSAPGMLQKPSISILLNALLTLLDELLPDDATVHSADPCHLRRERRVGIFRSGRLTQLCPAFLYVWQLRMPRFVQDVQHAINDEGRLIHNVPSLPTFELCELVPASFADDDNIQRSQCDARTLPDHSCRTRVSRVH